MLKRLNIAENPLNVDFSTPPRDRKLDRLIPLSTLLQYNCLTASSYVLMLTVQPSMFNAGQHYSTGGGSLVMPLVCHSSSYIGYLIISDINSRLLCTITYHSTKGASREFMVTVLAWVFSRSLLNDIAP